MKLLSRFTLCWVAVSVSLGLMTPALAQDSTPQAACNFVADHATTIYMSADTNSQVFGELPAMGAGEVAGVTPDDQWIGFDPGVAQAANLGLTRLRWIQKTSDIELQGNCENLPNVEPPPPNACVLTFATDVNTYTQPDTNAPVYTTLGVNDYAQVVGMQGQDWYAWASPGAQAGATGTINLRWAQLSDPVQMSGKCDNLPAFYPAPKLTGDICTILTGDAANSYGVPPMGYNAQPLPDTEVQILAQTAEHWYGFDPVDAQNGTMGITRLRWVQASDAAQINGDCQDIPVVDTVPVEVWPDVDNSIMVLVGDALSPQDSHIPLRMPLGDTLIVLVPANSADEWTEAETSGPTNDHTIVQLQGQPQLGSGGDRFVSQALAFTYQMVGVGQTTISLRSASDSFNIQVVVTR
jgi:hypothetical protein